VTTARASLRNQGPDDRRDRDRPDPNGAARPSPLLDMEDVAHWLSTSVRHVQRLVHEKRLPYVKVGHFVRFDAAEVSRWIDDQKIDGRPVGAQPPATIASVLQIAPTASLTRRPTSATEVLTRWKAQSR